MMPFLRICCVLLLLFSASAQTQYAPTFDAYLVQFNKSYPQPAQYQLRRDIYLKNMRLIQQYNTQNPGSVLAANRFTDLTDQELSRFRTKISADTSVGIPVKVPHKENSDLKVGAAASVDWRNSGRVSPAKYQGYCGSCWVFAAAAYIESYLAILSNTIYDISQQFLLECSDARSDCQGGFVDDAMSIARRSLGIPLETTLAYTAQNVTAGKPSSSSSVCSSLRGGVRLPDNLTIGVSYYLSDTQMQSMIQASPIVALVYAQDPFMHYSSGVYSCASNLSRNSVNHAVLVVGYTAQGHYIIKNSWGTSWGTAGFGIIDKDRACNLKLAVYKYWTPSMGEASKKWGGSIDRWLGFLVIAMGLILW